MNMDVATAIMSIRVSTDQCLMAGKMILHKFKSQDLCFLASKMVFVFIARIKTDDIVMGLDFIVSVVFSILVIEHFALKIKGVGMERMRGILNQNEFDEELVHELIKRIYVGMDNSVEVEFKCSDPYQEVLAIMSEVQNE